MGEPEEEAAKASADGAGHREDQNSGTAEDTHLLGFLGVDGDKLLPKLLDQLVAFFSVADTGEDHGGNEHKAHGVVEIASKLLVAPSDLVNIVSAED